MLTRFARWIDRNILSLGREMRLSYLPPLMVYMAYGISGLTGIVGTFFVKDYLGLSASFLELWDFGPVFPGRSRCRSDILSTSCGAGKVGSWASEPGYWPPVLGSWRH